MRALAALASSLIALAACGDVTDPTSAATVSAARGDLSAASGGATHTDNMFFATAMCATDIGYNIYFGGSRTLVEHSSRAGITRSFGTQDVQGWRLPDATVDETTVDYEVLGGAEMFNIKFDENGRPVTRIHEGTLVFAALDGSHKVIARHIIRNTPGGAPTVNRWECRIVG